MLVYWIWLAHRPGVKDRTKSILLERFPQPRALYDADSDDLEKIEGITAEEKAALMDKDLSEAERILWKCEEKDMEIITQSDERFPARLKNIYDPPTVLYCRGKLPDIDGNAVIGVVGTRHASAYGLFAARRMGSELARSGGIVVSGLADGIDAAAMRGALEGGGSVVGVLGCGADVVYPRCNRELFESTVRYGCILSEFPPGTPPVRWNFPKRNRIISGLSRGVVVVEAPEKSGALITAHQALDQGRDVFVVPGNVDMASFVGSNRLLRDGAEVVGCGWDILGEYVYQYPDKLHKPEAVPRQQKTETAAYQTAAELKKENNPKKSQKRIDNPSLQPYSDAQDEFPELSPEERQIAQALLPGERTVDEVVALTGMAPGKLLALLTMMELKGILSRRPGKRLFLRKTEKN